MASQLKLDEINKISQYFEIMGVSVEQKLERIELAEMLLDMFIFLFTYIDGEIASGNYNIDDLYEIATHRYKDTLDEYGISFSKYPQVDEYVSRISKDMVDSTIRESKKAKGSVEERALSVAQNESNTVFNCMEYVDAVNAGKKYKTWITENDSKVRDTHIAVDGERIGINEYFEVGNSSMLYPKDISGDIDPREVIGCRCAVAYS